MADDKHEKAVDLTESALDALEQGDKKKADQLIGQAKKLDPSAVDEVVEELDQAAHSSVTPAAEGKDAT